MPKFEVRITDTEIHTRDYFYEVEAETLKEAADKAAERHEEVECDREGIPEFWETREQATWWRVENEKGDTIYDDERRP